MSTFQIWQPDGWESRGSFLCIEALRQDWEGFRVLLRADDEGGSVCRVHFEGSEIYYRTSFYSFSLRRTRDQGDSPALGFYLDEVEGEHGGNFYASTTSALIEWIRREACSTLDNEVIHHFALVSEDQDVEVVSFHPPRVEWL